VAQADLKKPSHNALFYIEDLAATVIGSNLEAVSLIWKNCSSTQQPP
jgi:hypothetical protein